MLHKKFSRLSWPHLAEGSFPLFHSISDLNSIKESYFPYCWKLFIYIFPLNFGYLEYLYSVFCWFKGNPYFVYFVITITPSVITSRWITTVPLQNFIFTWKLSSNQWIFSRFRVEEGWFHIFLKLAQSEWQADRLKGRKINRGIKRKRPLRNWFKI